MTNDETNFWQIAPGAALTQRERHWIRQAAGNVTHIFGPRCTIVNIGVEHGASIHCLRAGAPEARIVAVEIDLERIPPKRPDLMRAELVQGDSREVWRDYEELEVALLFVDGGHEYEIVQADIVNWSPMVEVGGVMAFHDYAPRPEHLEQWHLGGVRRAVDEWVEGNLCWARVPAADSLAAFLRVG